MQKSYEKRYHLLEENNWWFRARRQIIIEMIKKLYPEKKANILEIGCSGGLLLIELQNAGFRNLCGIDISQSAINLAFERGIGNVMVMDGQTPKFHEETFDIIIASDVLEHIKNDKKALKNWNRILKPEGTLILFVPAFKSLWGPHDEANQHYRRYSRRELKEILLRAGFSIEKLSYWNAFLFLPTLIIRTFRRVIPVKSKQNDQLFDLSPMQNSILVSVLALENLLLKRINLPFGVSIFAIAKDRF